MSIEAQIETLITPPLEDLGLSVVKVSIHGSNRKVVEIMIERLDGQPVRVNDCVRASKEASTHLEVEDPIKGAYVLEVTSPGLDRPLVKAKDYQRFIGREVKLETYTPRNERKKFTGKLQNADDEGFVLLIEEGDQKEEASFKYVDIRKAKLVPDLDF